ncbi:uncharacterized protein RAG0_16255 [Rhynchosporium agropyri]|uniref:Uncharacterized protein n=1 Tax=Rhynchosporium agropyri TaxID=914238 RepID=A0A1E1LPL3_9HELO|nr:uncharacterized protein RAG0_16255 [Rhynchosporium agropyri]
MGQAFSGPNAFKFLNFTPEATAVLQRQPKLFLTLVMVPLALTSLGLLAFYIHILTNRPYKKPKPVKGAAKGRCIEEYTGLSGNNVGGRLRLTVRDGRLE